MAEKTNIEKFEELLLSVKRDGMDKLIEFIRKSDFYTAPASTKYHLAVTGGLLEHSLHVAECLFNKLNNPIWEKKIGDVSRETLIIVSLLHDVCKTYNYGQELKNQKTYDADKVEAAKAKNPREVKRDTNGEFIWETVPVYVTDDKYPLGHGNKSVFFIMQYIKLDMQEIAAITHHMGAYCDSSQWTTLGNAYEKWPLALALHQADLEATYLMESEK